MKAKFSKDNVIWIEAESYTEALALKHWKQTFGKDNANIGTITHETYKDDGKND